MCEWLFVFLFIFFIMSVVCNFKQNECINSLEERIDAADKALGEDECR